jgi:predicted  nucleic acid-binding Zn-ribbon protein
MIAKITEIDGIIDRLENMMTALREERDRAISELASLKTELDERELELLQMDEEMRREAARFEDERNMIQQERSEAEARLDKLASRIRELISFLPPDNTVSAIGTVADNTAANLSEG